MNDAVDRVIVERGAMDDGFPGGIAFSLFLHGAVLAVPIALSLLLPHEPPIKIVDGFAVQLPRGGGGAPEPPAPAPQPPASAPPETTPPAPKKPEPEKVKKPPKEEPRKGLPELDAKKGRKPKAEKTPTPRPAAGGVPGGTGTSTQPQGLSLLPPGPGTPDGSDTGGDWYLAGVKQKIWWIWTQQLKTGFTQSIGITFTILADGSLGDVEVTEPSGVPLLDLAAKRAVYSAAPFSPLPKTYGTDHYKLHAVFQPTP